MQFAGFESQLNNWLNNIGNQRCVIVFYAGPWLSPQISNLPAQVAMS